MCGIAGWVDFAREMDPEAPVLTEMRERLACRGPDAAGAWVGGHAALVHRRLVVIDPAGGGQPMVRPGPTGEPTVLVYNGELYNTDAVRAELRARGHTFRTRSDTEVVLESFLEWREACPEHLEGIFAFAVWDQARQRLFLARDRLGVKPLFYALRGRGILFASELKGLLAHPLVPPEVDAEGLAEVFALGPARTPGHGVFRGVRSLRPAQRLTFTPDGVRGHGPYWQLTSRPHMDTVPETADRLRDLLIGAIRRQLVSDMPLATLLSGGLDSSAVTAVAADALREQGRGPLRTYSLEFAGTDRDFAPTAYYADPDGPWVRRVAEVCGTDHRTVVLDTPEQVAALERAVTARDLPGLADIDASLYLFCREVRAETTVALSGEAADEIFGGYPWCHWEEAVAAATFPWARATAARAAVLSGEAREWIRPQEYIADRYRQALAEVPELPGEDPREARLRQIIYLNITRFLPTLLDRKDRMSMAVGLEVRVPFCDHHLVEYAWNIPWSMKSLGGQSKGIVRRALEGLLPPEVVARRKVPYPRTFNPTYLAATRTWLGRILEDPAAPLRPLVDAAWLGDMVARSEPPAVQWFGQTMSGAQFYAYLCQLDTWMRAYRVRLV